MNIPRLRRLLSSRARTAGGLALSALLFACHANATETSAAACGGVLGVNCTSDAGATFARAVNMGSGVADRTFDVVAEATPGSLRNYAYATASDEGGQQAVALSSFADVVHFSAPIGTARISVSMEMELAGSCAGTDGGSGRPNSGCYSAMDMFAGRGLNQLTLHLDTPGFATGTLFLNAGDDLPFSTQLQVGGFARFGFFFADFYHTGQLFLSSSTPGVSFSSDSGHDYARIAPVPEPSEWLLMLSGVGLLAFQWRRRVARDGDPWLLSARA